MSGTGNVGIGQTLPSAKLDVLGDIQFSLDLKPAGNASTTGQVLTSAGLGVAPTWTTPSSGISAITLTDSIRAQAWLLKGNAGTTSATNFIGTTDAQDVVIRTNNTEKMRVLSNGNVGIGTGTPTEKLELNGSIKITDGTQGAGKVLTSDAAGKATWIAPASIGGGNSHCYTCDGF